MTLPSVEENECVILNLYGFHYLKQQASSDHWLLFELFY